MKHPQTSDSFVAPNSYSALSLNKLSPILMNRIVSTGYLTCDTSREPLRGPALSSHSNQDVLNTNECNEVCGGIDTLMNSNRSSGDAQTHSDS